MVKRRLQFDAVATAHAPGEKLTPMGFKMTSTIKDKPLSPTNKSSTEGHPVEEPKDHNEPFTFPHSGNDTARFHTPFSCHLTSSPTTTPRSISKHTSRPMSLTQFHRSVSVPNSPLEEIEKSKNITATIRTMISPQRIEGLFKRRPCLVFAVEMDKDRTNILYTLLPVKHFDGKSILETDISPERMAYAWPISPNSVDVQNRVPLQTIPHWKDNFSYQLLVPTEATADRVLERDGRSTRLPEQELKKLQSFLTERGDLQLAKLKSQDATKMSPVPVQITSGITTDADSSSTLDEDAVVVHKLIEGIVQDKKAGGTLLDEVFETLDGWVTVGPSGRPLRTGNIGSHTGGEAERVVTSRSSTNRHRTRTRTRATVTGRGGNAVRSTGESNSFTQSTGRGMGRYHTTVNNRGGFRGGRRGQV
jgi:hypothetical protein